jgi:glycosyltransferase involved in cell wall biosynthesis
MLKIHRLLGTWKHKVNAYIALTEFGRRKFIENGLPANKVFVKGNLSLAPQLNRFDPQNRHGALFVGRLESEKGILTLLSAWRDVKNLPLRIVGTGSLHSAVKRMIETHNLENVELVGEVDRSEVWRYYQEASVLIVPSEWYEGFPLVIVEAYSTGIPVIASRIGGLQEIVRDGETGLLFNPGDHEALSARVRWVVDHPLEVKTMGERAREVHDREYSAEANYQQLLAIYISVMASR